MDVLVVEWQRLLEIEWQLAVHQRPTCRWSVLRPGRTSHERSLDLVVVLQVDKIALGRRHLPWPAAISFIFRRSAVAGEPRHGRLGGTDRQLPATFIFP
jgi:hypothetical protein